jgi:protein gp37
VKSSIEWTDATWNPTRGCTKLRSEAVEVQKRRYLNGPTHATDHAKCKDPR